MVKQLNNKPKGLFFLPIILLITICVFMSMVSAATLEKAHWTFNETSGTVLEDIAGDNNGTNNGATINQTGKINKAYHFDGINDYIKINSLDQSSIWNDDFTIAGWFYPTNDGSSKMAFGQGIVQVSTADYRGIGCIFNWDNYLTFYRNEGTNTSYSISDNNFDYADEWFHFAVTYDKSTGTTKFYNNGSLSSTHTFGTGDVGYNSSYDEGFYIASLIRNVSDVYNDGLQDDTRIYDFDLNSDDIALIYNSGDGTETPLDELRNPSETNATITNPEPPIYPTIGYDWNAGFIDEDHNSDYTYKYSFGFNNTDSFDGNERYIDTNQTLDYDQNTIKYFDLDYTPTVDEIGDTNYSFFRVYRYLDGSYDSNYESWSDDTFTIADNIVFDFNAPSYPDWANLFYPTKSYSGSAHYQDKSYQSGVTTYKYDLGSNDTNSLDGSEEYWKSNVDIASTDGNVNAYFEHTISEADKGKTLYAFLTLKRYYDGVYIDSETNWTDSFDVNYGRFRVQFYDGNCGDALDGNVHLENSVDIPVDENGLVDIWLDQYITTDGEAIETEAWREVAGVTTHTKRGFDYYLYLTRSYDLNASLLPIDIGANIQFMAKDIDDTLWANKYLMFVNGLVDICPEDQQLISTYISETGNSSNKRGVRFSVNKDFYITSFKIEQGTNPVDSWELWNYTLSTLIDSGTSLTTSTTVVDTSSAIKLDTNYEYSIVLFNDGGSAKFPYQLNQLTTPVNTEYIEYTDGCIDGALSCTSNNAYIVTDISVMDANNYETFFSSPIAEVKLLDNEGKGTFYLMADGNYSAILIDEMGAITRQYQKTTVNLKKPKDEITDVSISPYDVDVGGLLVYSLSNQTDAELNFNIFAGTTGYYSFTVVDYNATPTDREYIPRNYSVRVAMGSNYVEEYDLQPYLISDVDGIIPKLKIIDQLNRSVNDAVVLIYKYIDGKFTVVESGITDSTGAINWAAYPLDSYTIAVYYQEELKGTYVIRPRTSDDVYYIQIDLGADAVVEVPDVFQINWGDTKEFYNLNEDLVKLDNVVISNSKPNITGYTVGLYQGSTLIDEYSTTVELTNILNINQTFDTTTLNTAYSYGYYKIEIEYDSGSTKEFERKISLSKRTSSPVIYFKGAADDLGQPLAAILAIFLTGLLIALLTFSGLPLGKTGVAMFGIFVLGVFMWLGWLDSGVTVLGFDVSRFTYILVAMAIAFFAFKESVR